MPPKPSILSEQFWSEEERALFNTLAPSLLSVIFRGVEEGAAQLPKGAQLLLDWDLVNQAVLDYLNRYKARIKGISDTTAKHVRREIENWVRSGDPLPVLTQRLAPWFGPKRAKRIAVTEVTRLYADGNQLAWRQSGLVSANRWNTARDERVCPICAPLNGVVVPMGEGFTPSGPGLGPTAPPIHVNCRCWLTPVTTGADLQREIDKLLRGGGV